MRVACALPPAEPNTTSGEIRLNVPPLEKPKPRSEDAENVTELRCSCGTSDGVTPTVVGVAASGVNATPCPCTSAPALSAGSARTGTTEA